MSTTAIALFKGTVDDLLMQAEANGVTVSTTNQRMLITASGTSVAQIQPRALVGKVAAMCTGLCRTLGIHKDLDEFAQAEFMGYLQRNFPAMTLADVAQAFEFFVLGELDRFLPRDKDGLCDHKHYQAFAPVFYVPILKAYRKKQQDAKKELTDKVTLRLAEAKREDRDPMKDRVDTIAVIKDVALKVAAGEPVTYLMTHTTEWALRKVKMIPEEFEMTDDDIAQARHQCTRGRDSSVALAIHNVIKDGGMPEQVRDIARSKALRRVFAENAMALGAEEVGRRFDWLLEQYRKNVA